MISYNTYATIPEDPQVTYHLDVIQSKQQGLKELEERYKEKYRKYANILEQLAWLNACSSSLSIATGILSVVHSSVFL